MAARSAARATLSAAGRWGGVSATFSFALELAAAALAPPRCAACDAPIGLLKAFCASCASTVVPAAPHPADGRAAFAYGGAMARAIVRLKYERRPDLARPLGDLLWRALEPGCGAWADAVVVPVPLHAKRLAVRGFNQSVLLAQRVARGLQAPLWALALRRLHDTPRQATLDRQARITNVARAFTTRRAERIRGRRVLLVDDVRTTGATLEACEKALRAAGAVHVGWAVLAQAEVGAHSV
jgi:ComF family protein